LRLSELSKGKKARILSYQHPMVSGEPNNNNSETPATDTEQVNKMLDLGMIPGAEVEIRHFGVFGKDPIAVFVRGGIIAIRRTDASRIEVEEIQG